MGKKPVQTEDKYVLRLPDGLRDRIKKAADENNRSMNAEIVFRIEDYDQVVEQMRKLEGDLALATEVEQRMAARNVQAQEEVDRLHASLTETLRLLEKREKEFFNDLVELRERRSKDALPASFPEDRTLYVGLDANGGPISWQEIMTHLNEIGHLAGLDIQSIEARVFDANMVRNSQREEEWFALYQAYRKQRSKRNRA